MTAHQIGRRGIGRRELLGTAATAALLPSALHAQGNKTGVDASTWTPDYINKLAGSAEYDTAAECAKVVPLDYKGRLTYWYWGVNQASTEIERKMEADFFAAFAKTYPNIELVKQNLDYNAMLDQIPEDVLTKHRRFNGYAGNIAQRLAEQEQRAGAARFPRLRSLEIGRAHV